MFLFIELFLFVFNGGDSSDIFDSYENSYDNGVDFDSDYGFDCFDWSFDDFVCKL